MDTKALRQKILDLAIRGKLVPQDPNDEPASVLLERIREEKKQMVKDGKLKPKDIKNDTIIFKGEDNLHYEKFRDGTVKCIEDELPFEIPNGWEWCRLHNIYNFIDYRGATPTKISSGVPLITAKNVKSGYIDYSIDEYISEEEYQERQQRGISHKGDILFTTEAPLGNAALADIEKFSAGQRLITFQNFNASEISLYNELFLYFILSDFFQDELHEKKTGTTVAGIKAAILKTLWIPVPPYNEQIKIAKAIRKYIQSIDEIANNVEDLTDVVSVTQNKILDLAIRGKLIPQNNNDEPASVLLQRIRSEKEELIKQGKLRRDKKESIIYKGDDNSYYIKHGNTIEQMDKNYFFSLPLGWTWCLLSNIAHYELGKTLDKAKNKGNYFNYLRSVNIRWDKLDLSDIKQMKFEDDEIDRYIIKKGDMLICEGGDVGRTAIWDMDDEIMYQNALHRVRFYSNINPRFFLYYMMYYESKGILKHICKGVTIKHLTTNVLNSIPFALPPISEQNNIVALIDQLFSILDEILMTIE